MLGYWNRPEAAAEAFAMREDGAWLRTGDIAEIDAEGYIRIVDRSKDMIAVGGFKVFPSQVEAVLLGHPAVKEALVIGVPDAYRGEMPRAFVTLQPGAAEDGEALLDWLNARLGKHERVDAVVRARNPAQDHGRQARPQGAARRSGGGVARDRPTVPCTAKLASGGGAGEGEQRLALRRRRLGRSAATRRGRASAWHASRARRSGHRPARPARSSATS